MQECIVGIPGGGKSYWGVERCCDYIASGGVVVTNLPICGFEKTGKEGLEKYELSETAPIRLWLKRFKGWDYQPGQLRYIDQEMFLSNFLEYVPHGTFKKHVLLVYDEVSDIFDSLDAGRLKAKEDHYRKLFEFLRLHRHYHVDVVLLLQDFGTMNVRVRGLSEYVHKTVDMQGKRLAGIFFRCPLPVFARFTYDRSGKVLLRTTHVTKEKAVFALYDSYSTQGSFTLANSIEVDFTGKGLPKKEVKKMTFQDRCLMVGGFFVVACVFMFFGRPKYASGGLPAVSFVTVTNRVEVVAVASNAVPAASVVARGVTVEYAPISYGCAGDDVWAYAAGRLHRVGMVVPSGRVVQIERWGVRMVGPSGEHWIYHQDLTYDPDQAPQRLPVLKVASSGADR